MFRNSRSCFLNVTRSNGPIHIKIRRIRLITSARIIILIYHNGTVIAIRCQNLSSRVYAYLIRYGQIYQDRGTRIKRSNNVIIIPTITFKECIRSRTSIRVKLTRGSDRNVFHGLMIRTLKNVFNSRRNAIILTRNCTLSTACTFNMICFYLTTNVRIRDIIYTILRTSITTCTTFCIGLKLQNTIRFRLSTCANASRTRVLRDATRTNLFISLRIIRASCGVNINCHYASFKYQAVFSIRESFTMIHSLRSITSSSLTLNQGKIRPVLRHTLRIICNVNTAAKVRYITIHRREFNSRTTRRNYRSDYVVKARMYRVTKFTRVSFSNDGTVLRERLLSTYPFRRTFRFVRGVKYEKDARIEMMCFYFFRIFLPVCDSDVYGGGKLFPCW